MITNLEFNSYHYTQWLQLPLEGDIIIPEIFQYKDEKFRVTAIADLGFWYAINVDSIHLPPTVRYIGRNAFTGCFSLKSIHLPESVGIIGNSAFYKCHSLKHINIPKETLFVGQNLLRECFNLRFVDIQAQMTTIPYGFCCDCRSLSYIKIPDSVKIIEEQAFDGCTIENIVIPNHTKILHDTIFVQNHFKNFSRTINLD